MSIENSILVTIEDGNPHPLDDLCGRHGISFNRVREILDGFAADGLAIDYPSAESVRWRDPVQALSEEAITTRLDATPRALLGALEVHYKIDSTNSQLARGQPGTGGHVCLAEMQTAGRGRRGRRWVSPACANLYLSIAWHYAPGLRLEGLSLGAGLAAAEALGLSSGVGVGVKWPNDLYIGHHKLGGVLIESTRLPDGRQRVILGLGVNIAMGAQPAIDQPWTCLAQHRKGAARERNRHAAALLNALLPFLAEFPQDGTSRIHERWRTYDICYGRPVRVCGSDGEACGTGAGIDENFQFRLLQGDRYRTFASGDVSLRLS